MRQSLIPPRLSQPALFRPVPTHPSFQTLPPEIQAKTTRLLARLLREHIAYRATADSMRETRDE